MDVAAAYLWRFSELFFDLCPLFTDQFPDAVVCSCVELLDNIAVMINFEGRISLNFPYIRGETSTSYPET